MFRRSSILAVSLIALAAASFGCSKARIVSRHSVPKPVMMIPQQSNAVFVQNVQFAFAPGTQLGGHYSTLKGVATKPIALTAEQMDAMAKKLTRDFKRYLWRNGYNVTNRDNAPKLAVSEPVFNLETTVEAVGMNMYGILAGNYAEAKVTASIRVLDPRSKGLVYKQSAIGNALLPKSVLAKPPVIPEGFIVAMTKIMSDPRFTSVIQEPYTGRTVSEGSGASAAGKRVVRRYSDVDKPTYQYRSNPDNYALVIGIEDYKKLPDATYAERDSAAMRNHLLGMGYPQRNVIYLAGEDATRSQIQAYLEEWLPKNVTADSTVFFYFSGHGAPNPEDQQAYLMPWNGDAKFLRSTAYPLKDVYASLKKLKAKRIIAALDTCFSGAGGRSVLAEGTRPLVTKVDAGISGGGITVLSAASGGEVTGAMDAEAHGLFTYYLLKGLNTQAKKGKADVSLGGLFQYLKPQVMDAARRQNRAQTPVLSGPSSALLLKK